MKDFKFFGGIIFLISLLFLLECKKEKTRIKSLKFGKNHTPGKMVLVGDTLNMQWYGDTLIISPPDSTDKNPDHMIILQD